MSSLTVGMAATMLLGSMPDSTEQPVITTENMGEPESVGTLGLMAAANLVHYGLCTFIVDPDGRVRTMNPFNVFIDGAAVHPPDGKEPKLIRPIMTAPRPQYVAIDAEGVIWEAEFDHDDEPENKSG